MLLWNLWRILFINDDNLYLIISNIVYKQEDNSSPVSPQDYDAAPAAAVLEERQKPDQNHHDSAIDMDQTSSDIITSTITIATSPDNSDSTTTGQALTTEEISDEPTETSQETTTASPPFITTDENYYWATAGTTINRMVDNFLSESIRDVTNIKTTVYQAIGNVAADTTAVSFADEMTNADIVITTAEEEEVVTQPTTTRRSIKFLILHLQCVCTHKFALSNALYNYQFQIYTE